MNCHGIEIDVLSQASITAAKAALPGWGVGLAVAAELARRILSGEVCRASQLPQEYASLGAVFQLPH